METVSFTKMEDGTAEEYTFLTPLHKDCLSGVADTLLKILSDKIAEKTASELENYPDQSTIFFDDLKEILDEEEASYRN